MATEIDILQLPTADAIQAAEAGAVAAALDALEAKEAAELAAASVPSEADITTQIEAAIESAAAKPALLRLRALLAQSSTKAVNVAFVGSSSVAGNNATVEARRFVNRLAGRLQAVYPSGLGSEKPVIAWAGAPTATAGIQAWNAGQGGTTAADYLGTAPSSWQYLKFNAVAPAAVFHMVGSNDWALDVAPATYKANLLASIAAIDAQVPSPHVHVLLHAFRRTGGIDGPYEWVSYKNVMQEIAAANPGNILFIDLAAVGDASDLSGSDPLNLLDTDNVHPTDVGHALIADSILIALNLPPVPPNVGTTAPTATDPTDLVRLTSDGFGGANAADINGRTTDVALGGSARTWAATPANNVATSNGVLIRGAGTAAAFAAVIPETNMNIEVSFTITANPSGSGLFCEIHRQSATSAGTPNAYRIEFQAGVMFLKKWVGGNTTFGAGGSYAIGDRIAFRYYKGKLEVRQNGVLMLSATDTAITTLGYWGFSGAAATVGFGIEDVSVDALT